MNFILACFSHHGLIVCITLDTCFVTNTCVSDRCVKSLLLLSICVVSACTLFIHFRKSSLYNSLCIHIQKHNVKYTHQMEETDWLMAQWLRQASQWHEMCYPWSGGHGLCLSNPSWVELWIHSVYKLYENQKLWTCHNVLEWMHGRNTMLSYVKTLLGCCRPKSGRWLPTRCA